MVTITADVIFVSGIPFLLTFSRKIKFRTAEFIPKRTSILLAKSLKKVLILYARCGFIVKLALMYKEFDAVKENLPFLEVNTKAAREHVAEIECELWQVKDRVRFTSSEFPFQFIPTMILIYIFYNLCLWMNAFLIQSGITGGFSPRELARGLTVNFTKHCTVDVGAYVEASTDAIIRNGNNDRTRAFIALGPYGNRQGSINCFNLDTDQVVVRSTVKHMVWLDMLLSKANVWWEKGKNVILKGQIKFLNQKGEKFDWDNDDLTEI